MKRNRFWKIAVVMGCLPFAVHAKKDKKWDVSNPYQEKEYRSVSFTTKEGTWMNLDVSPDGKQIVFDLLGDIYIMPITGGEAKPLRTGMPFEIQPRFSPDGEKISFTSDAAGGDNIWVMNVDGTEARQVTKESFRLLNNATWTPDGEYLIARKHFTSRRSLGAGEIWQYHISGGTGVQLTQKKNEQQDVGEPCVAPDGKKLYFSEDMYPGGHFQYNKDPNHQIYVIRCYDMETGKIKNITGGSGGAVRPQISPDGKTLAFVRRIRAKSLLFIRNLATGEERPVYDRLSKDQQEAWAIFGVYTGFNWLPDNQHIIVWAQGKIKKININTYKVSDIPFTVEVKTKVAKALRFPQKVYTDNFQAKAIRTTVTSPDGKTLVFNAVGYLWKKTLPNGKPKRLTQGTDFEFEPDFSADGKYLVYVTWNDEERGAVYKMDMKTGEQIKLTQEKGIYRTPAFSANGKNIVYRKEAGNDHQGYTFTLNPGLYYMSATGGKEKLVVEEGEFPVFDKEGKRILYQTGGYFRGNLTKSLKSCDLSGEDKKTLFTSKHANRFVLSPDRRWVAFVHLYKVYVARVPSIGKTVTLTPGAKAYPVSLLSKEAGVNLHWSADNKTIHWTLGDTYFTEQLPNRFAFLPDAPDSITDPNPRRQSIGLVLPTDKPKGRLAFKGARMITMEGDEVIENGVLVVSDNKIEAIGGVDEVKIPNDAKVYDVTGKTVMPGLVDVHAHLGAFRQGLSPQKHWQYFANLAYGVTTTHDPSSNTEMVFSQSEMVKAGYMVGPRIYSTGYILYGAEGDFKAVINNLDDARFAVQRTKAYGAFSVKSYNQPRREQRQQILQAAREEKIQVYPEGGSTFFHNLTMIIDGHTGIEHNLPVAPLYHDVLSLWEHSEVGYTPTLIVHYGGYNGEYEWYQKTNVWEKKRLLTFTPRSIIDSRSRCREKIPEEEYINGHILTSKSCKKLNDRGVKVNTGGHGQLQGLGMQWELWMLQQGGMTNHEVLRAATLNGAHYLGMESEIGSLKVGKLADFIVLEKNPLEKIQNTEQVTYTILNGRMYDAATLNEIGNYDRKRTRFYWEQGDQNFEMFPLGHSHVETQTKQCGCCRD